MSKATRPDPDPPSTDEAPTSRPVRPSRAPDRMGRAGAKVRPSLYQTIIDRIRRKIVSGEWPVGTRLPSELELTAQFECSRMTVNKAMTQLAADGLVDRRRKAGTFVRRPQSNSAIVQVGDIRDEVEALGLTYHYEILAIDVREAGPGDIGRIGTGGPVLGVRCRHFAARQPFCLEDRLVNLALVPEAATADFSELSPGPWLTSRIPWSDAAYGIRAVAADKAIADLMLVSEGAPCLSVTRRTTCNGEPVTHVVLTYGGSDHEIQASFKS